LQLIFFKLYQPKRKEKKKQKIIHSPHLLVWATIDKFLLAWDTFRIILANESH
jgi:hypothetical protein